MGDGHTLGCFSSGDIVAPVGLEVCDGSHSLGVMKKGPKAPLKRSLDGGTLQGRDGCEVRATRRVFGAADQSGSAG